MDFSLLYADYSSFTAFVTPVCGRIAPILNFTISISY
jgi:hypothetical protein